MATKKANNSATDSKADPDGREIPIQWKDSEVPILYATNAIIQHSENEFIVNLFQLLPPLLGASETEVREKLKSITSVQAQLLARVVITPERMPSFIEAMHRNLQQYEERFGAFVEVAAKGEEETP